MQKHSILLSLVLVAASIGAYTSDFTIEDLQALPPFEEKIFEWDVNDRIAWLEKKRTEPLSDIERYRANRMLAGAYYYERRDEEAAKICRTTLPIKQDYQYRSWCVDTTIEIPTMIIEEKLKIAADAELSKHFAQAAWALTQAGWTQSQVGDIAGAFATYEHALKIIPKDNRELLFNTMFNTASMYSVHGDNDLVRKAIALLTDLKKEARADIEIAQKSNDVNAINLSKSFIEIANFNIGIAYTLHLYEYREALKYFDEIKEPSQYVVPAYSFAAIAAAELGEKDLVQLYISSINEREDPNPVVNQYLTCYRDMAQFKFNTSHSIDSCFNLSANTTTEVTVDVYKRLSDANIPTIELRALRKLKELFVGKIEPELKKRASAAASSTELQRLETENQLKSEILEKERELKLATEKEKEIQLRYFAAMFFILLLLVYLILARFRQKRKLAEQFEALSLTDGLTELGNRRFLENNITRELAYIKRHHKFDHTSMLGIFVFDLDYFKKINDTYGHDAGDKVLVEFSRRLKSAIRETDLLTRWGGEEFVYVARVKTENEITELAERLRNIIKEPAFNIGEQQEISVTSTIGIVKFPFFEDETLSVPWQQLISLADLALYWSKQYRDGWGLIVNKGINHPDEIKDILQLPLEESISSNRLGMVSSFENKVEK
ncbi:MAG: GGDEF domain-containing protein [Gammaproteobacteria bacterium]|nr:GGDEF domain-containing protein [Gammaproteobacteria bacterium]